MHAITERHAPNQVLIILPSLAGNPLGNADFFPNHSSFGGWLASVSSSAPFADSITNMAQDSGDMLRLCFRQDGALTAITGEAVRNRRSPTNPVARRWMALHHNVNAGIAN